MNSDKSDQQTGSAREVEPDHSVAGAVYVPATLPASFRFVDVEAFIAHHGLVAVIPIPVVGVVR